MVFDKQKQRVMSERMSPQTRGHVQKLRLRKGANRAICGKMAHWACLAAAAAANRCSDHCMPDLPSQPITSEPDNTQNTDRSTCIAGKPLHSSNYS